MIGKGSLFNGKPGSEVEHGGGGVIATTISEAERRVGELLPESVEA